MSQYCKVEVRMINAGILMTGKVEGTNPKAWDAVLDVNAEGVLLSTAEDVASRALYLASNRSPSMTGASCSWTAGWRRCRRRLSERRRFSEDGGKGGFVFCPTCYTPTMSSAQRAGFGHEAKAMPAQPMPPAQFILLVKLLVPALLMAIAWTIALTADVFGLPGGDLGTSLLRDTFWLQILTLVYVVTVSAIVCAPSDPVSTRLVMRWMFTTSLSTLFPRVVPSIIKFLEALGGQTIAQPVLATPGSVRPASGPQQSIPTFGFSRGASPQLE